MKFLKKVFNRLTITIALLAVEVVLFGILLSGFINMMPLVSLLSYVLSVLVVLNLVNRVEDSSIKIVWIIVIMMIPIFGGILFLLFGSRRPIRKMNARVDREHELISKVLPANEDVVQRVKENDERLMKSFHYIQQSSNYPVYTNTDTRYYSFGQDMFKDMLIDLEQAKEYIFLEYFIIKENSSMWQQIVTILKRKASEGVDVRLIYDDIGSVGLLSLGHITELVKAQIKIVIFNPFVPVMAVAMNNRDHRKILVVDGHVAYNGGINLADEYINEDDRLGVWKDTGIRLEGEAVTSFTLMFLETWNAFCLDNQRVEDLNNYISKLSMNSDGFVIPYGDSPLDRENLGENVYIEVLSHATNYVTIFTPYLIISEKMIYALQMAAKRGVDVRLLTPGIPDKKIVYRMTRSYYKDLLLAGVRIYEFTPGFLHAKSFLCDDELAVVGTINLDYRSLYLHFECATLLYKTSSISKLKEDTLETISQSREVTLDDCKLGFFGKLFNDIMHIFAPLM